MELMGGNYRTGGGGGGGGGGKVGGRGGGGRWEGGGGRWGDGRGERRAWGEWWEEGVRMGVGGNGNMVEEWRA